MYVLQSSSEVKDTTKGISNVIKITNYNFSFLEKEVPLTSSGALYKCSDYHARKVQEQALTGMFVAAAIKDLRPQVLPFMASMVRHYTMVAIAQQAGQHSNIQSNIAQFQFNVSCIR